MLNNIHYSSYYSYVLIRSFIFLFNTFIFYMIKILKINVQKNFLYKYFMLYNTYFGKNNNININIFLHFHFILHINARLNNY